MIRFNNLFVAVLLAGGVFIGTTGAATTGPAGYRVGPRMSGPAAAGVCRQIIKTQNELTKAYAFADKTNPLAEEVKAARGTLFQLRRDYAAALATMRARLAKDVVVGPLQTDVRDIEDRLAAQSDLAVRAGIAGELMVARKKLNAAEGEVMEVDADLAVAKARVAEASDAVADLQARRQQLVRQDPAVLACRQQIDSLRQQLGMR